MKPFELSSLRRITYTVAVSFAAFLQSGAIRAATDPSLRVYLDYSDQSVIVSWIGLTAVPYQVQASSNLTDWTNVTSVITGTGSLLSFTNSTAADSRAFFRVTRIFPAAPGTAVFDLATGLLTIVGTEVDDTLSIGLSGNIILVNGGAIPITGGLATTTNTVLIQVLALAGDDQVTVAYGLPPAHLYGDEGNDTLIGGNLSELFVGGPGNDTIYGNPGPDYILLGEGDDTFVWDPGDGSDIIEGEGGNDTMVFNGANIGENISLSANGSYLTFIRDVGTVTLYVGGVERVDFRALGGADNVVVSNLTGTAVTQVNVDLAAVIGGGAGDTQPDAVTINGTASPDTINITNNSGAVEVSGLSALVRVTHGELTNDVVVFNGLGGDLVNVNGSEAADTMTVAANGAYARTVVSGFTVPVDVTGALTLSVNGLGGTDTISCSGNLAALGIPLQLNGGDDNDTILGSNGSDTIFGGPGNDTLDGNQGSDVVYMGDDDDTFVWDPGDGSDLVEGQGGNDILHFNGANIGEIITLSTNGSRLQFVRNVGTVTLDVDGVERVDFQALGGADNVVVNSLAGTAVTQVNINLSGIFGGSTGDAQPDSITINGTESPDTINISTNAGAMEVNGLAAQVRVLNAEAAYDRVVFNGVGGDLVNINGTALADMMQVMASPVTNYVRVSASSLPAPLDVIGSLTLSVNGLGGTDTIVGTGNLTTLGIPIVMDGGDDDDNIYGTDGTDTIYGGSGKDFVDGKSGYDIIYLGDGDDMVAWNPAGSDDVIEGQGGNDILVFNGSGNTETFTLFASGSRLQVYRDVDTVTLDVDGVERVDLQALGNPDSVVVNSLAGTAVTQVNIDLVGVLGGNSGDAQADTVTVNGTESPDTINIIANAGAVEVSGLAAQVRITHSEQIYDTLTVNGLGGADSIGIGAGVTTLIGVITNP